MYSKLRACYSLLPVPYSLLSWSFRFHARLSLALALLVLCVLADHTNHPAAVDDLALHANLLYRCTDLHCLLPFSAHLPTTR